MIRIIKEALTFDDVLLVPKYSNVLPNSVDLTTKLTSTINLNIPIVSAAMDTVTESKMAIALAIEGGIGFIHKNMSIEKQVKEIDKVKKYKKHLIISLFKITPETIISEAIRIINSYGFSNYPVISQGKLIGLIHIRDINFLKDTSQTISKFINSNNLITANLNESNDLILKKMKKNQLKKILIVDKNFSLIGLIKIQDLNNKKKCLKLCKDKNGSLRVGAAVGVDKKSEERVSELVNSGLDVLLIDSSHGHSETVLENIRRIRKKYPNLDIIGGNVATGNGALALVKEGVNAVKVGVGPGSICTTRVVTGVGVPQITAIFDVANALNGMNIPIIADGGIRFSGDIAKAIAAGAACVMLGYMLAGTKESPGKKIKLNGRFYKEYRGMGSLKSIVKGSYDRYFQNNNVAGKLVPEGVEGQVLYKGLLKNVIYQQIGGLRSSMGLTGCKNINELKTKTEFVKITNSGIKESHVHNIIIKKNSPNYYI